MRCRWENRSGISPNRGSGWCRWPQQPPSTSSYACRASSAVVAVPLPPPHLCRTGDSDRGGRGGPKCQLGWGDAQGVGGGRIRRRASRRCHGRARDEGGGRGGGPAPPPWEGAGGGRGMGRRAASRGREVRMKKKRWRTHHHRVILQPGGDVVESITAGRITNRR